MQLGRRKFLGALLSAAGVALGEKAVGRRGTAEQDADDVADAVPEEDGCVCSENVDSIKLANLMR